MSNKRTLSRTLRWMVSVILVAAGLSVAWAWGQVARLAAPQEAEPVPAEPVLYAAWQPEGARQPVLFRSLDRGTSWEPLELPGGASPVLWADDGHDRVAIAVTDGEVLRSDDQGLTFTAVPGKLPVISLAWGGDASLYLGTDGKGIYRHTADGKLLAMASTRLDLASRSVTHLAVVGQRLLAATTAALFYTDDGGQTWTKSQPVSGRISALAALDAQTVILGTEAAGVLKSSDAGQTWQPASGGLAQAAGLWVSIDALRADPQEPGVLYAAERYQVGGTQLHSAPMGAFVSIYGGAWLPLAGPSFPQARQASALLVLPDRPLHAQAVTADGLQSYEPDLAAALAALESGDARARLDAARLLGLARSQAAREELLTALADPDPGVSLAAGEALGRIADPAAASGLLVALQHPDRQVQRNAALALGLMRVEAAVEPLRVLLMRGDPDMAGVAAEALQRIGSPAATQALLAPLADPERTTRQHAALGALEALGEPAVVGLQEVLTSQDVYARRNAAEALGWIGSPSATGALARALRDRDSGVRTQAAWALGEIGVEGARAALERARLGDPSAEVREAAGLALSGLGAKPSARVSWLQTWAPALSRWEMVRWLVPVLSLAGAAWLVLGSRRASLRAAPLRIRRR